MKNSLGNCCINFVYHRPWTSLFGLMIGMGGCYLAGRWVVSRINKPPETVNKTQQVTKEVLESKPVTSVQTPSPFSASFSCQKVNLETLYEEQVFCEVDIKHKCNFNEYLTPNEGPVANIASHLTGLEEGIHVFAGCERVFLQILYVDETRCRGVVSRDINHRAKAYKDFNCLLFRISCNLTEYAALSARIYRDNPQEFEKRIKVIRDKIEAADLSRISEKMKQYYSKYLNDFASTYLFSFDGWKTINFMVDYDYSLNEEQFLKIQRFVLAGSLISTIGDINDLQFLAGQKVTLVDVSNIPDYIPIDLKAGKNFSPKILWTNGTGRVNTTYHSEEYQMLTAEERQEFESLLDVFKNSFDSIQDSNFAVLFQNSVKCPCFYSKNVLKKLREYVSKFILQYNDLIINLRKADKKIESLTLDQTKKLAQSPGITKFLSVIFLEYRCWNPANFLVFTDVEGWVKEFEKLFSKNQIFYNRSNAQYFIEYLNKGAIYDRFVEKIGKQKWESLKQISCDYQ